MSSALRDEAMMKPVLLCSVLLVIVTGMLRAQRVLKVLFDEDSRGVIDRAVVVERADFSFARLEDMGRHFLASKRGSYKLLRLTVGADPFAVANALYGFQSTNKLDRYDELTQRIRNEGLPRTPIARLLALGNGAVLDYRDSSGFQRKLLAGSQDPTVITVANCKYRLLHFFDQGTKGDVSSINVFVEVSPRLSIANCILLTRTLKQRFQPLSVDVSVRTDTWFIRNALYPAVYPFQVDITAPSRFRYLNDRWVTCSWFGELHCAGNGFLP